MLMALDIILNNRGIQIMFLFSHSEMEFFIQVFQTLHELESNYL